MSAVVINRVRAKLVFYFFLFCFFVLLVRIFSLQFIPEERLISKAIQQHKDKKVLSPVRGSIFDANGFCLAMSVNVYTLKVVPCEIEDKSKVVELLAKNLHIDKKILNRRLSSKKKSIYIKRKVSEQEYEKIKDLNIKGVYFDKESKRVYPKAERASHILGFVGMDPVGLEGVEKQYDKDLHGLEGYYSFLKDGKACEILGLNDKVIEQKDGYNIYLSIDETIQYIVEREIKRIYDKDKPLSISAVVMEPQTGYILGMANFPNYNPNTFNGDFASVRNRIITDTFEPGSTFKIVTIAGALNEGVVSPEDKIFCENGSFQVKGRIRPLHDHKPHGLLTVTEVLQKSSNIGTVKIAMKTGKEKFFSYIRAFGFGEKTNIDIPGEVKGSVKDLSEWSDASISAIPMGQEIGATAIQMVSAMSAIANKGMLMKPRIVKEFRNSEGVVVRKFAPEFVRRVISEKTAKVMTDILEGVVGLKGTAKLAEVKGYKVAGKTGTSQKFDVENKRYSERKFIASFIGFLPADDPKLCILVIVNEPPYAKRYGGVIAAPVFAEIAKDCMVYFKNKVKS
ncbi:penicillin-binding protein 2 [bacterium]|nr:penicillin-binding protein 2 [bacterium]